MISFLLLVKFLPGSVLGFACDDDLYKNCKARTEAGDCEVVPVEKYADVRRGNISG